MRFLVIMLMALSFSNVSQAQRFAFNTVIPDFANSFQIYYQRQETKGLDPNSINILVWNILKGKRDTFQRDFLELQRDKDLILLQEYFQDSSDIPYYLQKEFETIVATSFRFVRDEFHSITGVATLSRVKSPFYHILRTRNREPVINTPKVTLISKYKLKGMEQELLVANIHAINFVGTRPFKRQIDAVMEIIELHDGPIIFGGDFNTWNKSRIKYLNTMTSTSGMKAIKYSKEDRKKFLGHPLDHVFIKGLEVKLKKVYGKLKSSDHKAMEAQLFIP